MSAPQEEVPEATTKIPAEHLEKVCKRGKGAECCRFIFYGKNGFECAKLTDLAAMLNERVRANDITARGDNCDGIKPS